jgi:CRISPR/Cas system-associated exonuclease Cas4 (RecB family)
MKMQPIWISPTILEDFLACQLRWEFERNPVTNELKRISDRAAVGLVVHGAIELLFSGSSFVDAWAKALSTVSDQMQHQWSPAVIPRPEDWAGYQLSKARLAIRAATGEFVVDSVSSVSAHVKEGENSNSPIDIQFSRPVKPFPWVEAKLYDHDLKFVGVPDLVIERREGLFVVDHKSGPNQEQATDRQRRQLLFYAWLIKVNYGVLPKKAEILTTHKVSHTFDVNEVEVEAVVKLAVSARESIEKISKNEKTYLSSSPSDATCAWCAFKVACTPHLETSEPDWTYSRAIKGRVLAVEVHGNKCNVNLEVTSPSWMTGPLTMSNLALNVLPINGDYISFSNFSVRNNSYSANWNTLTYSWSP